MCACVRVCVCGKKKGTVAGQKQPLGAVWCKTRLFSSGGQFDQLCNLIGGAVLARSIMLAHSRAIIAYGDGRPRSKVCVCVCVCVCMCVCVLHEGQRVCSRIVEEYSIESIHFHTINNIRLARAIQPLLVREYPIDQACMK